MSKDKEKDKSKRGLSLPTADPYGGKLYVSEVTSEENGIVIRGKFELPIYSHLNSDQQHFLETFLRCKGMLNAVQEEMGLSYPTVRARLENVLETLGLWSVDEDPKKEESRKEESKKDKSESKDKKKILEMLEKGEITPEEAKAKLKEKSR